MKKFLFATFAVLFCLGVSAQDMKKVRNYFDKKDWVKAKEAIDLTLANEKDQKNWEAWYYKGLIYGQVAKDATLKATLPDAWMQSFEAYQKAMELDSKQTELYMMTRSYPVFDNYLELQREGNNFYNNKDYEAALQHYKKADKVGRFIFKNKWALTAVDTILYYYAGAAAMQVEKMDEAISFFQKICDSSIGGKEPVKIEIGMSKNVIIKKLGLPGKSSITETANGKEELLFYDDYKLNINIDKNEKVNYINKSSESVVTAGDGFDVCYRYVTYYYDQKKDEVNAQKYAALGRKMYPSDTYYDKLDLDKMKKKGVGPDLFKQYEVVLAKEPKDYEMRYDYAAEIFNWLYMEQKTPADQKTATFEKIISQLKTCVEVNPKEPDAHLLLGKTYFNEAAAIQDEMKAVKGTTPADIQKKADLKKKMEERMKEAIPNFDAALVLYEAMTADQLKDKRTKNEFKTTLYLLTDAHRFLGNTEKEKIYQKKYDVLNQ